MNDVEFAKLLETAPLNANIQKYLMITRLKLQEYKRIAVSYSGGSDSDIMLDLIELVKPDDYGEIAYVFFDTGLEWEATRRHVKETEAKYAVKIETRKPKIPLPLACNKHGIPLISKETSHMLSILQQHNFDFTDNAETATVEKYGKCKSLLDWWFCVERISKNGKKRKDVKSAGKYLSEFIKANNPDFKISKKCCQYAKKDVAKAFSKEFAPDLNVTGMRSAEGGLRSASIKNCFTPASKKDFSEYRPLWFWSDKDKQEYKKWRNIKYSDCYEIWGFKRTGCVGCPINCNAEKNLETAKPYEPNKVKAAYAIFRKSYEYRRKYNEFRKNHSNS